MINTRQEVRDFLNERVGKTVALQDFSKPAMVGNYFYSLHENGNVERIGRGKYKILKKIELQKKGPKKGYKYEHMRTRQKDLSKLPAILNSSKQGLVLLEIEQAYQKVTPVQKQVNRGYLYRFFGYAIKKGIVKHNGINNLMRASGKGRFPKRLVLANKDITEEEWDLFVQDHIKWYTGKKSTKSKRKKKSVSSNVGMKSIKIINRFTKLGLNKDFVENHFLTTVKQYIHGQKISCLSVTGPDYNRHIENLFSTVADKVYVVEREKGVFQKIYSEALICPNYINGNVNLIKADLADIIIPDCQYIDLDLMGSIKGEVNIITRCILTQLYFLPDSIKFLTFTVSTRNDGGPSERFKVLQTIFQDSGLNSELEGFHGGKLFGNKIPMGSQEHTQLKFCYKRIPIISNYGCVIDVQVFTYQDTTPMLSILFVYK